MILAILQVLCAYMYSCYFLQMFNFRCSKLYITVSHLHFLVHGVVKKVPWYLLRKTVS